MTVNRHDFEIECKDTIRNEVVERRIYKKEEK